MAYRAGSAFISVGPNFAGWGRKVKAYLKANTPEAEVPLAWGKPPPLVLPPSKPHKVRVELDEGSFARNVRGRLEKALKSLPKAEIGVATTEAEQKIKDLRAELASLADKRIGVDLSAEEALREIHRLQAELAAVSADAANVQVRADTAEAAAELAGVHAMVNSLDRDDVDIDVDADTAPAMSKLLGLRGFLGALGGGSTLLKVGLAASPMLAPLLATAAGGLLGLGTIATAGIGGAAAFATVGGLGLKQALDGQKALTKATKDHETAVRSLQSAQSSLASAVAAADRAQVSAARQVADAERTLAETRRNAARSVADAGRAVAQARRDQTRQIQAAEQRLADARRNAADVAVRAQEAITRAQDQVAASQDRVRASLEDLHAAREQAKRDLEDLQERSRDNALNVEGAEIALIEAQQRLAAEQASGTASALDLRKARLEVAEAEDRLSDARRQSTQDAQALAKAEAAGVEGSDVVKNAQEQLAQARKDHAAAQKQLADAQKEAARSRAGAARDIARAEKALAQTRADAARSVAAAQRNLAQARQDAARSVAAAQRDVARARADAAASQASAARSVASAQAAVAAAQGKVAAADKARANALDQLGPAQKRAIRGVSRLKDAWQGFIKGPAGRRVLGAMVTGMDALAKVLPGVEAFIKPVARGFSDMFSVFGDAAGNRGFREFGHLFGQFASDVIRDAARGTLNLARGFGSLLRAFLPFAGDMSDKLVDLTGSFADWASTLSQSPGFRKFIAYVRENGPTVLHLLGGLVKLFVNTLIAVAPVGSALLNITDKVVGFFASINPVVLSGAVANIIRFWSPISTFLSKPIDLALDAISAIWTKIEGRFTGAKAWVAGPWKTGWNKVEGWLIAPVTRGFGLVKKTWGWIEGRFTSAKNWVTSNWAPKWAAVKSVLAAPFQAGWDIIKRVWGWVRDGFNAIKDWATGNWAQKWAGVKGVLTSPFTEARKVFNDLFGPGGVIRSLFSDAVDAIGRIWGRLRAAAAKPINFVIDTVYNHGIRAGFNKVADVLGLKLELPPMDPIDLGGGRKKKVVGAARGGVIPGTDPGRRDNMLFPMRSGEGVLVPEVMRFLTPRGLDYVNRTAERGRNPFAAMGGPLDWLKGKVSDVLGFIGHMVTTPVRALLGQVGSSPWAQMAAGAGKELLSGAVGWLTGHQGAAAPGGSALGPGIGRPGRILPAGSYSIGMPYLGYPGHYGADYPAPIGTPVFSPWRGRVVASYDLPGSNPYNNTPYRSYGRVVKTDYPNGLSLLFAHLSQRIGRLGPIAAGAMIGRVGMNGNATGPHLHLEARRNGAVFNPASLGFFDGGGLARQAGIMVKGPQPERVLSAQQTAAFERAMNAGFPGAVATLAPEDRALLERLANRPVTVKIGQKPVAEAVQEYRNERRLHGEPGWN